MGDVAAGWCAEQAAVFAAELGGAVKLTQAQLATLDEVSKPTLNFPAAINAERAPSLAFAGATVDGEPTMAFPLITGSSVRY